MVARAELVTRTFFRCGPIHVYKRKVLEISSSEVDRRAEESRRNASRRATWFAVSHTRKMMAEIDKALAAVFPQAPGLLSAFDEMRRWS